MPMPQTMMYLLDTNVISELRKRSKANSGVLQFFQNAIEQDIRLDISVITIGELRRGIELIRYRGDQQVVFNFPFEVKPIVSFSRQGSNVEANEVTSWIQIQG
jgi:predicted nucleic acid-binding protein